MALHGFLSRVWFGALAPIAGAVIVDVLAFFQLSHELAATVPALYETGIAEIVLNSVLFGLDAVIEQGLHPIPGFAVNQGSMRTSVDLAIPLKIAYVDPLSKYLMQGAFIQAPAADSPAFGPCLFRE